MSKIIKQWTETLSEGLFDNLAKQLIGAAGEEFKKQLADQPVQRQVVQKQQGTQPKQETPKDDQVDYSPLLEKLGQDIAKYIVGQSSPLIRVSREDTLEQWSRQFTKLLEGLEMYAPGSVMVLLSMIPPLGRVPSLPSQVERVQRGIEQLKLPISTSKLLLETPYWVWNQPKVLEGSPLPKAFQKLGISKIEFPVVEEGIEPRMTLYGARQLLGRFSGMQPELLIIRSMESHNPKLFKDNYKGAIDDLLKRASKHLARGFKRAVLQRKERGDKVDVPVTALKDSEGNPILVLENFYIRFHFTPDSEKQGNNT